MALHAVIENIWNDRTFYNDYLVLNRIHVKSNSNWVILGKHLTSLSLSFFIYQTSFKKLLSLLSYDRTVYIKHQKQLTRYSKH
jgi:hypothetical protein